MKNISILCIIIIGLLSCSGKSEETSKITNKEPTLQSTNNIDTVTFGEGCFWCIEPMYTQLKGVVNVVVGFSGGTVKNPSYREVSTGRTGHAEVAQIMYDPSIISFKELLKVFFATHDPTTLDRQGPDAGTQYRSVIFYHNSKQEKEAKDYKSKLSLSGTFNRTIVTVIKPFKAFYPAEKYHQNFDKKNPNNPYVRSVSKPRTLKFEKEFKNKLKQ